MQHLVIEFKKFYFSAGTFLQSLFFLGLVLAIFAMMLGNNPSLLQKIAPSIIWITTVLSIFISGKNHLHQEAFQGQLDQYLFLKNSLFVVIITKIAAHTLTTGVACLLICALLSPLFFLSWYEIFLIECTLILGFSFLSSLVIFGNILSLGAKGGGVLIALITFPLTLPIIFLSLCFIEAQRQGIDATGYLYMLIGIVMFVFPLIIWASTFALKETIEEL